MLVVINLLRFILCPNVSELFGPGQSDIFPLKKLSLTSSAQIYPTQCRAVEEPGFRSGYTHLLRNNHSFPARPIFFLRRFFLCGQLCTYQTERSLTQISYCHSNKNLSVFYRIQFCIPGKFLISPFCSESVSYLPQVWQSSYFHH